MIRDLSLAQIAALGATMPPADGVGRRSACARVYWISLRSPSSARSSSRRSSKRARSRRKPSSVSATPSRRQVRFCDEQGDLRKRDLKDMLVGNILAVSWPEVTKTALLYGATARSTSLPQAVPGHLDEPRPRRGARPVGEVLGLPVIRLVGFVVTSSVSIAGVCGVLLLIVQSSPRCSTLIRSGSGWRLAGRWARSCRRSASTCRSNSTFHRRHDCGHVRARR